MQAFRGLLSADDLLSLPNTGTAPNRPSHTLGKVESGAADRHARRHAVLPLPDPLLGSSLDGLGKALARDSEGAQHVHRGRITLGEGAFRAGLGSPGLPPLPWAPDAFPRLCVVSSGPES
eukprot:12938083-Alexandrium_andersonii.AAC.1